MIRFAEFDRSPAARAVMREASLAGVNCESVGEWNNLAARYMRLGRRAEAADCQRKAIAIAETWGARHEVYAVNDATMQKMRDRLAQAIA